ncbi:hypothetical protein ATANTOWER_000140 [Ataeniobius toweri]|uniref:Uncharacterized protein n=1 Tax=Ataeniobius toweri TaxID=208326 RepID=A0ABU7A4T5_9TELE|nr:hypothetical protein [Ataeniobius toweri]
MEGPTDSEQMDSKYVQQFLVIKEEPPAEEQNWSPRLDQEEQKPPLIKEEQEEAEITKEHHQRCSGIFQDSSSDYCLFKRCLPFTSKL